MYYRCELLVDGYSYQVTDNLVNWDDITTSFKRGDYDGVVRSFSTKFEFSNAAYSLLKRVFREKYLQASASVVFYTRNNSWLWNERFRCSLDFSTFQDNGSTISISAVDDSLAALIKAKKGTQYEYVVSELTEGKYLYYDGIEMNQNVNWLVAGNSIEDSTDISVKLEAALLNQKYFPLVVGASETSIGGYITYGDTFQQDVSKNDKDTFLFRAERNITCFLNVSISFKVAANKALSMQLIKVGLDGSETEIAGTFVNDEHPETIFLLSYMNNITLLEGEYCFIKYGSIKEMTLTIRDPYISLNWDARIIPVNIDIVTPVKLLNRILQSINGGQEGITGEIVSGVDKRLDECMIVPAESARGLKNAKLYCSYTKFVDWMQAEFGFVPVIGEDKVTFVHRNSLFSKNVVKDFGDNIRSFEYNVNSALIYSRVRAGYDKQDYDSVNGRDEFHFTNEYTTGVTLTENSLELISPFRADAYGIEFLVQKRGEDTTDSDSDNDVFFVNAKLVSIDGRYRLVRTINGGPSISGVISPDTMFNAVYSPRYMIEANRRFIGAFTNTLDFASSDGNSDVVIDGVPEKIDIQLSEGERLFTVGELSVESGDMKSPEDLTGLISIEKGGETYHGYIKDGKFNYGRSEAVKYTLIVESIK